MPNYELLVCTRCGATIYIAEGDPDRVICQGRLRVGKNEVSVHEPTRMVPEMTDTDPEEADGHD